MTNPDNIGENVYSGFFGVADYESVIRFSKFKIGYSRWRPSTSKTAIILVKMYIRGFLGSLFMNPLSNIKFEMADSIWRMLKLKTVIIFVT